MWILFLGDEYPKTTSLYINSTDSTNNTPSATGTEYTNDTKYTKSTSKSHGTSNKKNTSIFKYILLMVGTLVLCVFVAYTVVHVVDKKRKKTLSNIFIWDWKNEN